MATTLLSVSYVFLLLPDLVSHVAPAARIVTSYFSVARARAIDRQIFLNRQILYRAISGHFAKFDGRQNFPVHFARRAQSRTGSLRMRADTRTYRISANRRRGVYLFRWSVWCGHYSRTAFIRGRRLLLSAV